MIAGRRFVTTFRAAHLIEISIDGAVLADHAPAGASAVGTSGTPEVYSAAVAWRTVALADGSGIAMVHQRGRDSSIVVEATSHSAPSSGYGAPTSSTIRCPSSVVHAAVTFFDLDGAVTGGGGIVANAVLPVDVAVHDGDVTFVAAGNQAGHEAVFSGTRDALGPHVSRDGCSSGVVSSNAATSTAVAYDDFGLLLRLERDPAVLVIGADRVALGGAAAFDTGHALFHGNVGTQVACASCHPEGGDDGRSWTFDGSARRTQTISGGVSATAPLHWDGAEANMDAIVSDVMVRRMRAAPLSDAQTVAFSAWIDAIPAVHGEVNDAMAVLRGRALFEGVAGCDACHSGEHLTSNSSEDVGTGGGRLQVPSLVGVSLRFPLMRSGCATTMADRFVASCGGSMHGHADRLDAAGLVDLTAYLESL